MSTSQQIAAKFTADMRKLQRVARAFDDRMEFELLRTQVMFAYGFDQVPRGRGADGGRRVTRWLKLAERFAR